MIKKDELLSKIQKAGIVGGGGAGFPTYFKLGTEVENLIINGAECEPLLETDKTLLRTKLETIFDGIEAAAELLNVQNIYIGIKEKYPDIINRVNEFSKKTEVYPLKNVYPVGDEHILVREITGRIIPEGGIPLSVSCVVHNVETMYHLGRLINGNEPWITRFLTVSGNVKNPFVAEVPVGTPVKELIEIADPNIPLEASVILDGGPMMGKFIGIDSVVNKTTSGILIFSENSKIIRQRRRDFSEIVRISRSACIQCRRCTDFCPRYLNGHRCEPHKWMRNLAFGELTPNEMVFTCCECGVCELFACPMDISPRLVAQIFKEELFKNGVKNEEYHMKPERVRSFTEFRELTTQRLMERLDIDQFDFHPSLRKGKIEPKEVKIFTDRHIGTPSEVRVKKNEKVKAGDIIADHPKEGLGINYHASISGTVVESVESFVRIERK